MPRVSVWLVRTAFVQMGFGFVLGALLLFNKGIPVFPLIWTILPLHIEVLLLGWLVQLAMGVAFWILPRDAGSRGNVQLVWTAYVLLNTGVLLAGSAHWLSFSGVPLIVGRSAELVAISLFAINAWPRIRPVEV